MKRITILAAAGALVATPALGAWAAYANSGSDDTPTAHVRVHARHGADDAIGHVRHARHGADDPAAHQRHSGEVEPGDDNGGQGEVEPGDDNGGTSGSGGSDDGGHHGGDDGGHGGSDD